MVGKSNVPVLRPSRKDFSKPFTDYISSYFSKHPDVPIIKVVPPAGYRPRRTRYPIDLRIDTPIQQNVRFTPSVSVERSGLFVCLLVSDL